MNAPLVSVIIASHRPEFIGTLLSALRLNRYSFETIAVCDYETGRLENEFPEAVFHTINNRSISVKRNFGVSKARAEIVAFVDDDCVPSPEWVEKGHGILLEKPDISGVEGLTTIENTGPAAPPSLRDYRRLEQPGFRTNNIFYRKTAFLEAGGFDERFTVQREDIDLAFSVLDLGHTIGHDTGVRVMHRVRRNEPWDLLKNCINRRFDPLLYKKHASRYREHIKTPFPPTLLLLLVFHAAAVAAIWIGVLFFTSAVIVDAVAVTAIALRRGRVAGSVGEVLIEWVSCFCAPIVLFCALLYGAVRYRKLLLV
jgi:glycosyltransferase involved in cell wall biosynthesis